VQLQLHFTTAALLSHQGLRREMGVIFPVLTFCFFCVKAKEKNSMEL